ncbi:MAG: hypothetical protein ACI9G9_000367 [Psychromonas sp.]|jgi:hypothetical protein
MKTLLFTLSALLFLSACNKKIDHLITGRVIDAYDSSGVEGMNVYVYDESTLITDQNGNYSGTFEVDTKNYHEWYVGLFDSHYNNGEIQKDDFTYRTLGNNLRTSSPTNKDNISDFIIFKSYISTFQITKGTNNYAHWKILFQIKSVNGEFSQIMHDVHYHSMYSNFILAEGLNEIYIYVEKRDDPSENYTITDNIIVDKNNPPTQSFIYQF